MNKPLRSFGVLFLLKISLLTLSCAREQSPQSIDGTFSPPNTNAPGPPGASELCVNDEAVTESLDLGSAELGRVESRVWRAHATTPKGGVVFVSGVDGGFIEPVDGIYERIAAELSHHGVASIFVRYRSPGDLTPSIEDIRIAADYLNGMGVQQLVLVGWSFGGAVISHGATMINGVKGILGLAPQARDTEAVRYMTPEQSVLLFHSEDDENVPYISSQQILDEIPRNTAKQLVTLKGYNHLLEGAQEAIDPIALNWLKERLNLVSRNSASLLESDRMPESPSSSQPQGEVEAYSM